MKTIIQTYLGTFFLFLLIGCSVTSLTAAMNARVADLHKTQYIREMEDSDFAEHTLRNVFEDAEKHGYQVVLQLYQETNGLTGESFVSDRIHKAEELPSPKGKTYMVRMELTFPYSFPFLNTVIDHTLLGYAK